MRMHMSIVAAVAATMAASPLVTASSAATSDRGAVAVTEPSQLERATDRNIRRTPEVLVAAMKMSPGCSSSRLPIDCTITEPIVTRHDVTYPFSFLPGDRVRVAADGCVQTGGFGQTWKRYVDPAADNDLYHGLIDIPGATGNLKRLVNVVGRQFVVGGRGGSLILGYEDDDYSDNGYYAHDDGTGGQCRNSVNAFVHIVVS